MERLLILYAHFYSGKGGASSINTRVLPARVQFARRHEPGARVAVVAFFHPTRRRTRTGGARARRGQPYRAVGEAAAVRAGAADVARRREPQVRTHT